MFHFFTEIISICYNIQAYIIFNYVMNWVFDTQIGMRIKSSSLKYIMLCFDVILRIIYSSLIISFTLCFKFYYLTNEINEV